MRTIRRFSLLALLTVIGGVTPMCAQDDEPIDLEALYLQLDEAIAQSPQYVADREKQIDNSRQALLVESDQEKKFQIAEKLFTLYKPFRNDSAFRYAELCISLADAIHRPDLVGLYRSRLARQCSNTDMFTESLEQLRMVDKSLLDNRQLTAYYEAWMHVCGQIANYSQRDGIRKSYFALQDHYRDSVLMVAEKGSEEYLHLKMDVLCARQQFQEALHVSDSWLNKVEKGTQEDAYAAFYRFVVYDRLSNHKQVRYWLGKSALDDIQCGVMDQASLLMLADHLSQDGDLERAYRYMCFGKDCNLAFCPTLRNYQVNLVLSVIEANFQKTQASSGWAIWVAAIIIALFLIALLFLFFRFKRKNRSTMTSKILLAVLMTTITATTKAQTFDYNEVAYTPEATTFKLFAPQEAKRVQVTIYDGVSQGWAKGHKMKYSPKGYWELKVKGDLKGKYYTFNVADHTEWAVSCVGIPGTYKTYYGETPGVFAKAVGVNGKRGYILDMKDTNPEGWSEDKHPIVKSPADLVIYEMHHRDFSIARRDAKYPGKFLALTEPWAIEHLKQLGVNAIHILPSYDFGSVDESKLDIPQYNWGYDPVNYNVPEGSYSTNPDDPMCRIREFKLMVQALHKAGIRVILDVVYNHTYDIDHSNFQRTYPDYYYRKTVKGNHPRRTEVKRINMNIPDIDDGVYSNGSGCGNETASEQPMMRKFMIESVKYWINEYHIDGFRFDLMGVHDIKTMNEIRKAVDEIDPTIFIYGEGWSAGECAYPQEKLAIKANIPQMPCIAAFSDEIRDALRGSFDDDTKCGWLGTGIRKFNSSDMTALEESLKFGIAGAIEHPQVDMSKVNYSKAPWALEPTQMISYVSCHDDMCLTDRLRASVPGITEDELIRLDLLAQTVVFTSQGVPFMLSGEELLRDKKGVHNSFESPDSVNHLDWDNKTRYPQVFEYYKNLIALRQHHPAFRLGSADLVRKHLEFLNTPEKIVAYRLTNYAGRDDWRNIIVILNAGKTDAEITIPNGNYTIVCCDGQINEKGLGTLQGTKAIVDPQSALIIHD